MSNHIFSKLQASRKHPSIFDKFQKNTTDNPGKTHSTLEKILSLKKPIIVECLDCKTKGVGNNEDLKKIPKETEFCLTRFICPNCGSERCSESIDFDGTTNTTDMIQFKPFVATERLKNPPLVQKQTRRKQAKIHNIDDLEDKED